MAGLLTENTVLSYKAGTATDFTEIANVLSVPSLGGSTEQIEVTVLTDHAKKYIPGLVDYGTLDFSLLYDNSAATSNFRILKGLDDDNTLATYKVTLPDGTVFTFDAYVAVSLDEVGVNDSLKFTASMYLQSEIAVTNP